MGVYDSNKNVIAVVNSHNIGTVDDDDSFIHFTIAPPNIPSNAAFIVLVGNSYTPEDTLSVIRTA